MFSAAIKADAICLRDSAAWMDGTSKTARMINLIISNNELMKYFTLSARGWQSLTKRDKKQFEGSECIYIFDSH